MEERKITKGEAKDIVARPESHFWDFKSKKIDGKTLQKTVVAMLNADGGDIAVGIENPTGTSGTLDLWDGFSNLEEANQLIQTVLKDIQPSPPVEFAYLSINGLSSKGIVLQVHVHKSENVHQTSAKEYKIRKGAQNLSMNELEVNNLRLSKGLISFEDQLIAGFDTEELLAEPELATFLNAYSPRIPGNDFVRIERLIRKDGNELRPTYAGALLFATKPQAVLPKRCGIKITRYATSEENPLREHLKEQASIEGPLYRQIDEAVKCITSMVESVSVLGASGLEKPKYPTDAIKEVLVNAVIHRDYNLSDDVQVLVFDNRIEIKSPGRLPGHITAKNMRSERFARNPKIVRILNRYPDPPNKDIGEGLRTAFEKMLEMRLKEPQISVSDHSVLVTLPHEPLAVPEESIMEYLSHHDSVTNKVARQLTGIKSENAMKDVFYRLRDRGLVRLIPAGGASYWRKTTSEEKSEHKNRTPKMKRRAPRSVKKKGKKI
jgi:ATP-dependent DNA helicase RecG